MVALSAVRAALAEQIATIAGLRTVDHVPGQVSPPVAVVRPTRGAAIIYQQTMGPDLAADMTFDVVVLASAASDRAGQAKLDGYLSTDQATSIWLAVKANESLGGLVSYAYVDRVTAYGLMEYGGVEYLAATLAVICGAP